MFCLFCENFCNSVGFLYVLFEELIPLWFTSTRHSGGLDFSPPQIGLFLLIMGMSNI
jgi:hypothetical protein